MLPEPKRRTIVTHWGIYYGRYEGDRLVALDPIEGDGEPSPIGSGMVGARTAEARIPRPAVRAGTLAALQAGRVPDGAGRGAEPFTYLPWDEALDIAAQELDRVRWSHGNEAIFGGSYGWSSAGRFHHAQSQIHRFLNAIGGYTKSVQNYSFGTAMTLLPHILGDLSGLMSGHTSFARMTGRTETLLMFGGAPRKNTQVSAGGVSRHMVGQSLQDLAATGARMISVSPIAEDLEVPGAEHIAIRPGSDTAFLMGVAHVLIAEDLLDRAFLARCTVGFDRLEGYLTGAADGVAKTPDWAAALCGCSPDLIRDLARHLAATRSLLTMSWSLQRADHGEQPYWMLIALAAMLGQIGQPGGGFGFGYGSVSGIGGYDAPMGWPALSQLSNPVRQFIPVARITDALMHPGGAYDYDGERRQYPDLRLVYWAGGNPFHHHQDLNRLRTAWRRPETVIVNECWWNPIARHADIVFPATTPMERNDIAASSRDHFLGASHKLAEPFGESRSDYDIFAGLSRRLGAEAVFTEGRDEEGWLRHLYAEAEAGAGKAGMTLPEFDRLWEDGLVMMPPKEASGGKDLLSDFVADPTAHPLRTPSGRIEIFSETIDGFGYEDCPGHPSWLPPKEWLGSDAAQVWPLHLISNQPKSRLHSQYDVGAQSRSQKVQGREAMLMNPADAAARGLGEGDLVRVFNDRGACLSAVRIDGRVMPGVVQLATGAWFDPGQDDLGQPLERHGNPNVLTADRGTSRLTQGSSAQSCLVEVERYLGHVPRVAAFDRVD